MPASPSRIAAWPMSARQPHCSRLVSHPIHRRCGSHIRIAATLHNEKRSCHCHTAPQCVDSTAIHTSGTARLCQSPLINAVCAASIHSAVRSARIALPVIRRDRRDISAARNETGASSVVQKWLPTSTITAVKCSARSTTHRVVTGLLHGERIISVCFMPVHGQHMPVYLIRALSQRLSEVNP